jgi:hypothetical protein
MTEELSTDAPCLACGGRMTADDNYRCRNSQGGDPNPATLHADCREMRRVLQDNFLGGDLVAPSDLQDAWRGVHAKAVQHDSIDTRPYRRAKFLALTIERRLNKGQGATEETPWFN